MENIRFKWSKYYAEYISVHKKDNMDLFELTNKAINYCMEKLGLNGRMVQSCRMEDFYG